MGMWLIAALLGGFAVFAWVTGRLGDPREELQPPPVEVQDTARIATAPPSAIHLASSGRITPFPPRFSR